MQLELNPNIIDFNSNSIESYIELNFNSIEKKRDAN